MKKMLFRFDDIHPLMNAEAFKCLLSLADICPSSILLCVIPENKDLTLIDRSEPLHNFWEILSEIENKGVIIGLHGLSHLLHKSDKSILNVSKQSEYTSLSYQAQKKIINKGLLILRSKGLNPKFFAAPAHGFDMTTIKVLKEVGFLSISDGYFPGVCQRYGLTWIPLKTWNPKTRFIGSFNTVCIHLKKNNFKKISRNILEVVNNKKNISFESALKTSSKLTLLDLLISLIYAYAIKLLFLKRRIEKLGFNIYNFFARIEY